MSNNTPHPLGWPDPDATFDDLDGYASTPTHVRLYSEDGEWFVDGYDGVRYTEACWSFDTFADAVANVADFVKRTEEDYAVTWTWEPQRKRTSIRRTI